MFFVLSTQSIFTVMCVWPCGASSHHYSLQALAYGNTWLLWHSPSNHSWSMWSLSTFAGWGSTMYDSGQISLVVPATISRLAWRSLWRWLLYRHPLWIKNGSMSVEFWGWGLFLFIISLHSMVVLFVVHVLRWWIFLIVTHRETYFVRHFIWWIFLCTMPHCQIINKLITVINKLVAWILVYKALLISTQMIVGWQSFRIY